MTAEIISVGTEILMGQIVNTNAQYISTRLTEVGINQYYQTVVGDNSQRLRTAIAHALERSDLVVLTGGLGPTGDDLTKETTAEAMGKSLELNASCLAILKERFQKFNRNMTENNLKQAMFPPDCIILPNPNGTAPGCIMERDGKAAILLPGPPREMAPMFDASVMPYLKARNHSEFYSRVVRIFGMGESAVETSLKDLMDSQSNPTIAPYALTGETTLRVTARCRDDREGEALVAPTLDAICRRLGPVVYSTRNHKLEEVCAMLLTRGKLRLSVAESCTGGMLASTLISVPGSSNWFFEGIVGYSNEAKISRLGVREETLNRFGAVSAETAGEMAQGLLRASRCDIALSTTGIAGPDGGTDETPVGLVYLALASASGTEVTELRLTGSRDRIRNTAVLNALDLIRKYLLKNTCNIAPDLL